MTDYKDKIQTSVTGDELSANIVTNDVARTAAKTVLFIRICLRDRYNRISRQITRVKMPFRLAARTMLYKAAPIPTLERINECLRFARLQKNTATLATA